MIGMPVYNEPFNDDVFQELQNRVKLLPRSNVSTENKVAALQHIYENCCWGRYVKELVKAHGIKFLVRIAVQEWPEEGDVDHSSSKYDRAVERSPGVYRSMRRMAIGCLAEMINYDPYLQAMQHEQLFQHLPAMIRTAAPRFSITTTAQQVAQLRASSSQQQFIAERLISLAAGAARLPPVALQLLRTAGPAMVQALAPDTCLSSRGDMFIEYAELERKLVRRECSQRKAKRSAAAGEYDADDDDDNPYPPGSQQYIDFVRDQGKYEEVWPPYRAQVHVARLVATALQLSSPEAEVMALLDLGLLSCLRCRSLEGVEDGDRQHTMQQNMAVLLLDKLLQKHNAAAVAAQQQEERRRQAEAARLRQAGNAAFNAGDHSEALSLYGQALSMDYSSAALFGNRSLCLMKLGRPAQAAAEAQCALLLEPRLAKWWGRLGDAMMAGGGAKVQTAQLCYRQALKLAPGRADIKARLAQAAEALAPEQPADLPADLSRSAVQRALEVLPEELLQRLRLAASGGVADAASEAQLQAQLDEAVEALPETPILEYLQLAEAQVSARKAPQRSTTWVLSWTDTPFRHSDSGLIRFAITIADSSDGAVRIMHVVLGEPKAIHLLQGLLLAIAFPKSSSSPGGQEVFRPSQVLVTHRCAAQLPALAPHLAALGISAMLETAHEARMGAAEAATEPSGYNWRDEPDGYKDEVYGDGGEVRDCCRTSI